MQIRVIKKGKETKRERARKRVTQKSVKFRKLSCLMLHQLTERISYLFIDKPVSQPLSEGKQN